MANDKKTLLLLGGSEAQLIAIEAAKKLGYRTVLCDYLSDNPGRKLVDSFYLVSTTDLSGVLEVAKEESIDGVVAYGSDPAAPTAAYVSGELGLRGVPYKTAKNFCNKHLFRDFLQENGFDVPWAISFSLYDSADSIASQIPSYPAILKPTDSSGSKGVTVVRSEIELKSAIDRAAENSRNGVLIVEEFIERDHPHVIEAEIFVVDGTVQSWGLMNSVRDKKTNPLLPAGYSMPLSIGDERINLVRNKIQKLVDAAGIKQGAMNIEMIVNKDNRLFFLDAGPRNGGNMLPEFIGMASGKDLVCATLRAAMEENADLDVAYDGKGGYWGLVVLHSFSNGRFKGVEYSPAAQKALQREYLNISEGDPVRRFDVCGDLVGLSFFSFEDEDTMKQVMENINENIKVLVA